MYFTNNIGERRGRNPTPRNYHSGSLVPPLRAKFLSNAGDDGILPHKNGKFVIGKLKSSLLSYIFVNEEIFCSALLQMGPFSQSKLTRSFELLK